MANIVEASCLPQIAAGSKYHIVRQDFVEICDGSLAEAAILRVFEQKTNQQMAVGRSAWISCSLREIAEWSVYLRSKSSFATAVQRLLARGYIRMRRIARPGRRACRPATEILRDERGEYIIVDDDGTYADRDGARHNIREEGWIMVKKRQYQLNIDEITRQLARLSATEPEDGAAPAPVPKKKSGAGPVQETTTTTVTSARRELIDRRGGTQQSAYVSLRDHDTIENHLVEASRTEATDLPAGEGDEDDEALTPEAVLELARYCGLKVPSRPVGKAGLAAWMDNWFRPAQRLAQRAKNLWGEQAEIHIEAVIRYMTETSSPSWWQTGRKKKSPITLRHVADNLTVQWSDLQAKKWRSPLMEPEPGEDTGDAAAELERLQRRRTAAGSLSMTAEMVQELAATILAELPGVVLGYEEVQPGRYVIGIEYAPDQWVRIEHPVDYWNADAETARLFEQAIAYGQQLQAQGQGGENEQK